MKSSNENAAHELYIELCNDKYAARPYHKSDRDEQMELVEEVISGYFKPRYLLDHEAKTAVEFMSAYEILMTVTADDILWDTLDGMKGQGLAHRLDAHYPTNVRLFSNGVAEVSWQINPDGMYFMDEDGFGMTNDQEEKLYGYIDRQGRVVSKFRAISNFDELKEMEREAIKNVNKV